MKVQREKEYSYNLKRFIEKVNTLMRIKGKARCLVPSLLTKLLKFSPCDVGQVLGRTTLNPRVFFYSFALVLLVCSIIVFFYKYYVLS